MKKIVGFAAGALAAALVTPSLAQAQSAYTTTYVNLRAGPGFEYPVVMAVPQDAPLDSYGCLNDWSWCDVSFGGNRGWMSGEFIAYVQDNRWVPVYDYGPRYGVPVVSFEFGTYWDRYYRGRPWYNDRNRWSGYDRDHHNDHRPPPHHDMSHVSLPHNPPPNHNNNNNNNNHHDYQGGNDHDGNDHGNGNGQWQGNGGNNGNDHDHH